MVLKERRKKGGKEEEERGRGGEGKGRRLAGKRQKILKVTAGFGLEVMYLVSTT